MDKNDIIEYVMHTPHNTNRAVLTSMLNQLAKGGSDDSWTVLTEESVTTSANMLGTVVRILSYSQEISADTIRVTFDGTEYECEKIASDTENVYGATRNESTGTMDWSEYPFSVVSVPYPDSGAENALLTETEGTYTIKIEAPQSGGSSDFSTGQR